MPLSLSWHGFIDVQWATGSGEESTCASPEERSRARVSLIMIATKVLPNPLYGAEVRGHVFRRRGGDATSDLVYQEINWWIDDDG